MKEKQLSKVRDILEEARELLDNVMYGSDIPDDEYERYRRCYDHICKANDQI